MVNPAMYMRLRPNTSANHAVVITRATLVSQKALCTQTTSDGPVPNASAMTGKPMETMPPSNVKKKFPMDSVMSTTYLKKVLRLAKVPISAGEELFN